MKIELQSFILEKMNITNSKHLQVIKEFDRDYIVKNNIDLTLGENPKIIIKKVI